MRWGKPMARRGSRNFLVPCKSPRRLHLLVLQTVVYSIVLILAAMLAAFAVSYRQNQVKTVLKQSSKVLIAGKLLQFNNLTVNLNDHKEAQVIEIDEISIRRVPFKEQKEPTWEENRNGSKLIQLWTSYFSDLAWKQLISANNGPVIRTAANNKCFLSYNRNHFDEASSVVFHARDIEPIPDLPEKRLPNQKWVFYNMESPMNCLMNQEAELSEEWFKNLPVFNWTMTYNRNMADVPMPHVEFSPLSENENQSNIDENIENFAQGFNRRKYDALWVVSNCGLTHSRREHLVSHLKTLYGLSVNIIGNCNGNKGRTWQNIDAIAHQHRFYFAFENSICDDYMTEKAMHAYDYSARFGMIPVLYGAGSKAYREVMPEGSYVDVDSFAEVMHLGTKLRALARSEPEEIANYFKWQKQKRIDRRDHVVKGFHHLCDKMWSGEQQEHGWIRKNMFKASMGSCSISKWFVNQGIIRWDF